MSKKLLLADDSITIQKVIGITFAHVDYDLTVVDNGDAALEKIRNSRPDLVLADVFMPGKNGYELCAAVKQDPVLKGIPVLLLSGTFEPFDEDKAKKAGADSWIAKPFESQALIDRVEELLSRRSTSAASTPAPPRQESFKTDRASAPVAAPAAAAPSAAVSPAKPPAAPPAATLSPQSLPQSSPDAEPEIADDLLARAAAAAEIEPDMWAELEDLGDGESQAEDEPSDDLWQSAPLEEGLIEGAAKEEDPWAGLGEDSSLDDLAAFEDEEEFLFEEEPEEEETENAPLESQGSGPGPLDGTGEQDIFFLDEGDILEEEDLATAAAAATANEMKAKVPPSSSPPLDAPPKASDARKNLASSASVSPVEEIFLEEEPVVGTPGGNERFSPSSPTQDSVEASVRAFSEKEISEIVERVAGSIIERLAGSILEKVVWEVVPDLAETMVREEILKIKEGAGG